MMLAGSAVVVPSLDPLGIPGPPLLFVGLQMLTLVLHLLFMNLVVGGQVLALVLNIAALTGRREANPMANILYQTTPAALSMAITMGVAPLLFLQVLYGPYFYSANLLLGFAWFSLVVVLLLGFYLTYLLSLRGSNGLQKRLGRWDERPGRRLVVGLLTTAAVLWVAWILTINHELAINPKLWAQDGEWASPRWYVPASSTIPRYLHSMVGATAIGGLWAAAIGWWRARRETGPAEVNAALVGFGLTAAGVLTAVQIVLGLLFLLSLDKAVFGQLMGFKGLLGSVWTIALLPAICLPVVLVYAVLRRGEFKWFVAAGGLAMVVFIGMAFGHEQVRFASLAANSPGGFELSRWSVYPQWALMVVFLVLLVIGLGVVGVMMKWITDRGAKGGSAGGSPTSGSSLTETPPSA
ncbi:MAG TPA: hypothetical protein PKY77_03340 [Phycisphaerae bacterium]|nr:hypothetical protein [Phycisphaerae bacterium]HRY67367.1 hypothetical protein [Phycisphaerae bacterium]HSA29436.1 hypothetical protein [Phycisphaerae bacterium]